MSTEERTVASKDQMLDLVRAGFAWHRAARIIVTAERGRFRVVLETVADTPATPAADALQRPPEQPGDAPAP